MKIKTILEIIKLNEDFKTKIKNYKEKPETRNLGEVLENNYHKWLNEEVI